MLWGDWNVCVIETPRSSLNKISCTRQFESKLSLRSFAKSLDKRRIFRKSPRPSLPLKKEFFESLRLPLAKGSSTSNQAFLLRRKDVTALRCSEPLRSKVGGPSKVFARLCGMGPPYYSLLIGAHGNGWLGPLE